jgi:hypothetical protein
MLLLGKMELDGLVDDNGRESSDHETPNDPWSLQAPAFEPTPKPLELRDLYLRTFHEINPDVALSGIQVRFRKYANANSRIRLENGYLSVDIGDVLQGAPLAVHEALSIILVSKMFKRTPDRRIADRYRRYLNANEMRRHLHRVKQSRGRKIVLEPKGAVYDLRKLFEDLNNLYFNGLMAQPVLGWSRRQSVTVFGHYDPSHHAIVLNSILDSEEVEEIVVRYVLFHEMLHIQFPVEQKGSRRCVHTREFKAAERRFADFKEAQRALKLFADRKAKLGC